MYKLTKWSLFKKVLCCLIIGSASTIYADPPSRAIRLNDLSGTVSFSPAGENNWIYATRNRPLTMGDKLWNDNHAESMLQLGGAAIALGENTSVGLLNLTDNISQFQLTQGTLLLRVDRIQNDQRIEIDTPNLAFSTKQPGDYRIEVSPDGKNTTVSVRRGQAEIYGEKNAYVLSQGQAYRFSGTDLSNNQSTTLAKTDDLDQWFQSHFNRSKRMAAKPATANGKPPVSPDVIGYEDLNQHGSWAVDTNYGNIWYPPDVPTDWAPYRDGNFVWIEPWGWSWVGLEPWGFAPYHYGRWCYTDRWGWVPGPFNAPAIYAPALVGFIAGNIAAQASNIGWFPLGPRDLFFPSYSVSRNYFMNINAGGTALIGRNALVHAYNYPKNLNHHLNLEAPNAVTSISKNAFMNARLANKNLVPMSNEAIKNATITQHLRITPDRNSLLGSAEASKYRPSDDTLNRSIIARSKVPAAVPFSARQEQLQKNPGRPLEAGALAGLAAATPLVMGHIKNVYSASPSPISGRAANFANSHAGEVPHPPRENVPVESVPQNRAPATERLHAERSQQHAPQRYQRRSAHGQNPKRYRSSARRRSSQPHYRRHYPAHQGRYHAQRHAGPRYYPRHAAPRYHGGGPRFRGAGHAPRGRGGFVPRRGGHR